jgi:environmental stress-induced protein Ves
MAQTFNHSHFKIMPWKNGGGLTTELYIIHDPKNPSDFLFRLSKAFVESSGPFSLFPDTERTLILLQGGGFHLKASSFEKILASTLESFVFSGKEAIECTLIKDACIDFNIMIKNQFGRAKTTILKDQVPQGFTTCDLSFIYDINRELLHYFTKGERIHTNTLEKSTLILIEVSLK